MVRGEVMSQADGQKAERMLRIIADRGPIHHTRLIAMTRYMSTGLRTGALQFYLDEGILVLSHSWSGAKIWSLSESGLALIKTIN